MKNKRSLIINCVVLLFCVLTFVFLACAALDEATGWQIIQEIWGNKGGGQIKAMATPILMQVVLMGLLTIAQILKILAHFNVIKCKKFNKIVRKVAYLLAILVVYTYLIIIIQVSSISHIGEVLGWGSIVNIVIGVIAGVLVIVNRFLNKLECKKCKKENCEVKAEKA